MQSILYNWLKKRGLKPCKGSPAPYFYELVFYQIQAAFLSCKSYA